eukprot:COSAG01_NODE_7199_length_3308_cov_2.577127_2_plen_269_part_00
MKGMEACTWAGMPGPQAYRSESQTLPGSQASARWIETDHGASTMIDAPTRRKGYKVYSLQPPPAAVQGTAQVCTSAPLKVGDASTPEGAECAPIKFEAASKAKLLPVSERAAVTTAATSEPMLCPVEQWLEALTDPELCVDLPHAEMLPQQLVASARPPVCDRSNRARGRGSAARDALEEDSFNRLGRKKRATPQSTGPIVAWTASEVQRLHDLVAKEGVGAWAKKAKMLGTGRTAKALNTRWLREIGSITDGAAARKGGAARKRRKA